MTVDSPSAQDPGPRPDPAAPEREEIHLKLLASLKAAGDGGELGVVRRLATWIDSPRVLAAIASHPPWFEDWGVKEAFVRNEHTPEEIRARCGQAVGVLDLLRELDGPGLSEGERHEIRDQARALIHSLPADDRERVRRRAKELSASRDERGE
ncbi:MAG TPA: hypothetical protein VJG13_10585, partial [Thermoanaerobaculia bacterium]|nr:hypothetical protein [Thermoanaerobaculia bacterium]